MMHAFCMCSYMCIRECTIIILHPDFGQVKYSMEGSHYMYIHYVVCLQNDVMFTSGVHDLNIFMCLYTFHYNSKKETSKQQERNFNCYLHEYTLSNKDGSLPAL